MGPDSSYSCFEIHMFWNVLRDARIEPPIHTEYLRSGNATTLIFIVDGAKAVSSFTVFYIEETSFEGASKDVGEVATDSGLIGCTQ